MTVQTTEAPPDPDDLRYWRRPGNDTGLWPEAWNRPITAASGEHNPLAVPEPLRPHYNRTLDRDREIVAAWPITRAELVPDPLRPLGGSIMIARADFVGTTHNKRALYSPEREAHLLHVIALQEAIARKAEADTAAREHQLDLTERACACCGSTADPTVHRRRIGTWTNRLGDPGPRLCQRCASYLVVIAADEFSRRARLTADDPTPAGPRALACQAYLDSHERRLLP